MNYTDVSAYLTIPLSFNKKDMEMKTLFSYATCKKRAHARCEIFGANTQCAGTAPTFSLAQDREIFSADFIREVDNRLYSFPENFKSGEHLWDSGNLNFNERSIVAETELVSSRFEALFQEEKVPICLGGDHVIKYSALKALDTTIPGEYGVVYLDAHPDCEAQKILTYSSILHHGFLMPNLKPRQIMLTGIRQFTENEAKALKVYQSEIGVIMGSEFASTSMDNVLDKIIKQFSGLKYLYFSIDLDGLNPSCAPAVESPYPGGPSLNQIIYLIQHLKKNFTYIGMDISEFIPELDKNNITALSAARIMKEFYSVVV